LEEKQLYTIVTRSIGGDRKSQKALYDLLSPMMLSVAHRYANNKTDAEDIFQESVLNVFDRLQQLRDPEKIAGWAKKVVVHEAIRFYKKKRNLFFSEEFTGMTSQPDSGGDIYRQLETDELLRMVQQLPDKIRIADHSTLRVNSPDVTFSFEKIQGLNANNFSLTLEAGYEFVSKAGFRMGIGPEVNFRLSNQNSTGIINSKPFSVGIKAGIYLGRYKPI